MSPITPQLLILVAVLVLLAVTIGTLSARLFVAATRARKSAGLNDGQTLGRR